MVVLCSVFRYLKSPVFNIKLYTHSSFTKTFLKENRSENLESLGEIKNSDTSRDTAVTNCLYHDYTIIDQIIEKMRHN